MSVSLELGHEANLAVALAIQDWMTYVSAEDGQIHSTELALIDQFLDSNGLAEVHRNRVYEILRAETQLDGVSHVIRDLCRLDREGRIHALRLGFLIAYADGYLDIKEQSLLLKASHAWKIADEYEALKDDTVHLVNQHADMTEEPELGRFLSALNHPVTRDLLRVIESHSPKAISNKVQALHNRLLVSGEDYDEAILKCRKITDASLRFVEPMLQRHTSILSELAKRVDRLRRVGTTVREEVEVQNAINQFLSDIRDVVQSLESKSNHLLESKRRTRNYYTIAFMGKTKAGKSTLHAVVTKSSSSQIGVGRQRTTRYNWVYQWRNIRMIDTPGIGAPGGLSDEEIARSVVDEVDVVVYLVKNDSIQETEFRFLKELSEQNKPLIILLNVKENLADPSRLSRFLNDPEKIYTRKDHKSLDGHIERIKRYVEEHYQHTYFDVIPVQLYAALLARDEQHAKYATKLYRGSHIQSFLDSLRVAIIEDGPLRRVQNVVNGSYLLLHAAKTTLNGQLRTFQVLLGKLTKGKEQVEGAIAKQTQTSRRSIQSSIEEQFHRLESSLYSFAMDHFSDSEDEIQVAWKRHLSNLGLREGIQRTVETEFENYATAIKQYAKELGEDLSAWYKFEGAEFQFDPKSSFSMRLVIDIVNLAVILGGAAVEIAALLGVELLTGPPGWIAAGITVLGLGLAGLRMLFKSKDTKRREAVDHLHKQLRQAASDMKKEALKTILQQYDEASTRIATSVARFHTEMIESLQNVIAEIEPAEALMAQSVEEINRVYAWQILGLESGASLDLDELPAQDIIKRDVNYVERPSPTEMLIHTSLRVSPRFVERLGKKLQMRVQLQQTES